MTPEIILKAESAAPAAEAAPQMPAVPLKHDVSDLRATYPPTPPDGTMTTHSPIAREWVPEVTAGVVVLILGVWELYGALHAGYRESAVSLLVPIGTAAAVTLVRRAGWWSLGIVWLLLILQTVTATDVMLVEFAVAGVAFGLSRWGSKSLLWASGLSIPFATVLAAGYISVLAGGIWHTRIARNLIVRLMDAGISWPLVVLPLIACVFAVPWFAGLAARYGGAARASQQSQFEAEAEAARARRERTQMEEIATLREGQARLARDVHDVVGHSLTVILAQAESAQFIDDDDQDALKRTMANIAGSARSSLHEVRAVLVSPDGSPGARNTLDTLIDATRASGNEIAVNDAGVPRPLPPELATVAFRVLQEMLTNALKHGRRGATITVTRGWGDELRITVTNQIDDDSDAAGAFTGNGIEGMRRRLVSVGGSLEVRRASDGGSTFSAAASLPVRADQTVAVTR